MSRAAVLLAAIAQGCSAILAAGGDPDLERVHVGATRRDVEKEVGGARKTEKTEAGTHAVYRIRLGDPADGKRASRNLSRPLDVAFAAPDPLIMLVAVPVALVVEGAQMVGEMNRHSSTTAYLLDVTYDREGRVVSHHLSPEPEPEKPPAPEPRYASPAKASGPSDAEIAREWRKAKARYNR